MRNLPPAYADLKRASFRRYPEIYRVCAFKEAGNDVQLLFYATGGS